MRDDLKDLGLYALGSAYGVCVGLTAVEGGVGWTVAGVATGLLSIGYVIAVRWGDDDEG